MQAANAVGNPTKIDLKRQLKFELGDGKKVSSLLVKLWVKF